MLVLCFVGGVPARSASRPDAHFALLAAHSRDIILFTHPADGRILEANTAASRHYGYSRDELLGLGVFDLGVDDERERIEADGRRQRSGGLFRSGAPPKDGSVFQVEVSGQGAAIDGESVLISVIRDITDGKTGRGGLREAALFPEQNPSPVLRVRRDGLLLFGNSAARRLCSPSATAAVGERVSEDIRSVVDEAVAAWRAAGIEIRCAGREISFDVSPGPGRDYANLYGRDVTGHNAADRHLAEAKSRQELLAAVVGRLLGSEDPREIMDGLARQVMEKLGCQVYSELPGGGTRRSGCASTRAPG